MSACPQCGTVAKPTDKFCNTCGTPLAAAPPPAYGAPPPPPPMDPGYGAAAQHAAGPARCQMGHEIAPGASYCAQGHPIALDAMQFAADPYAQQQGYGQAPPQPQGFGAPPPPPPPAQYGYAPPPQPGYGAQPGFQQPPPPPAYQPSPSPIGGPGGFGMDPNAPNMQQGYGQPPQAPGFGPPQGFGQPPPPPPPAFPAPQQGQGFGAPPPQPVFNAPAAPPAASNPYAAPAGSPAAAPDPNNKTIRGFLVAYQTNTTGDFWPLAGGRLIVGRTGAGDGIDIPLSDPTISSRHATFVVDGAGGSISLEDTGSTNGTFVNDEHVGFNGRRELKDGDRVRFGGFTTIVKIVGRV